MAAGPSTRVSDIITPSLFTAYVQQATAENTRLIEAGVLVSDGRYNDKLTGGGITFNEPSFDDLDMDDVDRVSTDTIPVEYTGGTADPDPAKITTLQEVQVRLSRNFSWNSTALAAALAGADPMGAIVGRVGKYWGFRLQEALIATMNGVIADNTANDSADYTYDASGSVYKAGITSFNAKNFFQARLTLGDAAAGALNVMMVHSVVHNRMLNEDLIDFVKDSSGGPDIPMYKGHRVVVSDKMPNASSVYDTWFFGPGALRLGMGVPLANPATEVHRLPGAGNGAGAETLYSRTEWIIHPVGHAYTGTAANGGPSNAATTNNLAHAGSWNRVFSERKQIKFARLVTREA